MHSYGLRGYDDYDYFYYDEFGGELEDYVYDNYYYDYDDYYYDYDDYEVYDYDDELEIDYYYNEFDIDPYPDFGYLKDRHEFRDDEANDPFAPDLYNDDY